MSLVVIDCPAVLTRMWFCPTPTLTSPSRWESIRTSSVTPLRDRESSRGIEVAHARKFRRRQRRQHEAAAPGLNLDFRRSRFQLDAGLGRQAAADVEQLAGRDRRRPFLAHGGFAIHRDLDLHVRAEQVQAAVFGRHQHIAQDGQGLAPFDDIRNGLERG